MWELDHKEGWAPKNWCFWTVELEKTLESLLDSKEIHPVNPPMCMLNCSLVSNSFWPPMDCSPPGSSVHAIYQARILEWGAISYFRGYSQVRNHTCVSWVSCIGRRILYHWATWKATISQHIHTTVCHHFDNELMRKSEWLNNLPQITGKKSNNSFDRCFYETDKSSEPKILDSLNYY